MKNKNFFAGIIENKLFVIIIMIMVFIAGGVSYYQMPKQHFPKVVLPVASVAVVYPGATAEDIEALVTDKVEHICMEINGYDKCETTAYDNYCVTTVTLSMDLSQDEVDKSFDDLKDKLDDLKPSLPSGVSSITVKDDVMDTAGLILSVTGDNISNDELAQRSNEVSDKLRLVEGVRKVDIYGDTPSEVKVTVDTKKLNDINVSLAELSQVISYHNSKLPTGTVNVDGNEIKVSTSGQFESIDDIKNIVVSSNKDNIITRLSDIADIRMEMPDDEGYYIYNDSYSTILAVYFEEGLNVVSVGDDVNKIIDDYNETLPEGVKVNKIFMQPNEVEDSINSFIINLLESIILVIIVIMIGMNFRNAVVVSFAIPLAIFASFICTYLFGYEIQFVSLASLIVVLGMLVDNAVVVSDAIQKNLDLDMDRKEAVVKGVSSVALPVFISMLTTALAFSSLFVLPGAYRQLSITFPVVIICCLVASYIVSVTVTPLMSYFFLKKTDEKKSSKVPPSRRLYDLAFSHAFKNRKATILVAVLLMCLCGSSIFVLRTQIVPTAGKDIITIEITGNKEDDIKRTREIVDNVEDVLKQQPETEFYLSAVGTSIPRYDYSIMPKLDSDNLGDIFVKVDFSKGDRFKNAGEMVDFLQAEITQNVGGATFMVDELGIFALNTKPVEMKIYSDNIDDLNTASEMINNMMASFEGTKNIQNKNEIATYNYHINMDKLKLNTLGLMEAEAQNELSIAMMGRDVSSYRSGNKEYNVVLDANIDSREDIKGFKVKSSVSGNKYAVSQFADVSLDPEISSISRVDGRRGRVVGCYVGNNKSDMDIQTQLEKMIDENIDEFPQSVTIEKSGKKKQFTEEVLVNIGKAAFVAFVAILLMLLLQFGSLRKVAIIFISVPFGLAAGVLALLITGQPLSLFALIGSVSLLGCVLANAIVLVDCINNERDKGMSVEEACKSAGGQRLRPIMMSSMTTVLGLLPLALFGDALFVPMAILMLVGLLASMIVNLIMVPMVYYMVFKKEDKEVTE
ncbi:MAG: efflux RND transporter permease subunit [Lachnospirales bacterium]